MKPPWFQLLLVFVACSAPGIADIRPREMYGVIGYSVIFPSVNITKGTVYDFRKGSHILIVTYHGSENIRPPYKSRVHLYLTTGEIQMTNLTEDDSGTYEQVVNMTLVAVIRLLVIEPPTLRKVNETIHGDQCHVLLECKVQGSGPLNVTFLKDGEEITENITTIDRPGVLSVDGRDPGSSGIYTCILLNPISVKSSSEITITPPDEICKKETRGLPKWIIICIIIFIVVIAVCIGVGVYKKCQKSRERNSSHNSGGVRQEDASETELQVFATAPPGDGRRQSSCNVSIADEEESGDDMIQDKDLVLPKDDSPNHLTPGQCGQGASTVGLCSVFCDQGQEAVR